ncbi:MAG: 50S ribosomal protein L10 [Victivallales bacterium]|jgi:large subunit ribosomal protein L10|nr:50S ribosomal protein L10 [Victivallales bacterium]
MRAEKQQLVEDLKGLIGLSNGFFLIGYKGLSAAEFTDLRTQLAALGSECHVIPNRLFKRAAQEAGVDALAEAGIAEDNAIVCGGEDVAAVAKALKGFAKQHEGASIRMGVVDGNLLTGEQVAQLAELPPKAVLLAMLLGTLQAPATQLVQVLNAKLASIVYVLSAHLKEKEQAA